MQCVIIAGGRGTRLKEFLGNLPKALVTVGGRPLLEHQILLAKQSGIDEFLILTGHGDAYIKEYLGDGSNFGVRIEYQSDPEPLGTAGAVLNAFDKLQRIFLVLYGDVMLDVDFRRMLSAHPPNAQATLLLHPNSHPFDSDLVEVDQRNWICGIHPYPHSQDRVYRNLVNAALYVCTKRAFADMPRTGAVDFGKHLFPEMLKQGMRLFGYISTEYIRDVGTPKRLLQVREHYRRGMIARRARPAIFLDRDGTLNSEVNWLRHAKDLKLLPSVGEAVRMINESGYLAVVITNQPVIARGECTEEEMRQIHDKLEWQLGLEHAYLDAIYLCPHHPHKGFPGERADLKGPCACRKPGTALFKRAINDLNIDLSRSWMIGDRDVDIAAAKAMGIRSALIRSDISQDVSLADLEVGSLLEAVSSIFNFESRPKYLESGRYRHNQT